MKEQSKKEARTMKVKIKNMKIFLTDKNGNVINGVVIDNEEMELHTFIFMANKWIKSLEIAEANDE